MDKDRKFLRQWLLESTKPELLDDELNEEELNRMTVNELSTLAGERQKKLRDRAEAQKREPEALRKHGRLKFAGMRGVVRGGKEKE